MKRILAALLVSIAMLHIGACGGSGAGNDSVVGENSATDNDTGTDNNTDILSPAPGRIYPIVPLSCELPEMRRWVNANMLDYYLFYDQVVTPNLTEFDSLEKLVTEMRVAPNDRFSYITNAEQASAQFDAGKLFGFGQYMVVINGPNNSRRLRISHVDAGSPFGDAGIRRGDYLVTINGKDPFGLTQAEIDILYGIGENSANMDFGVQTGTSPIRNYTLTSTQYSATTVADSRVLEVDGTRIGYVAFTSFLETSRAELDTAFASLRQQNVSELVLDLRYNRGGRVSVANKLASMILGSGSTGNTFITVALNDKYSVDNQVIPFTCEAQSLNLNRVLVLTTGSSCSASELVINSLRPFMEVILIGENTCGKPYGSLGREACGQQMNALEYEFVNASNAGAYYDGITADCRAVDDLEHAIGDQNEAMLGAALGYIQTSSCQPVLASRRKPLPAYSPRPWQVEIPGISDLTGTLATP